MTYSVDVYNAKGKVVNTISLNPDIFADAKVNTNLIHEYYILQQANARLSPAHTKTRAEVQGSGRKLFKQKGTGNARPGDLRSPIRRKGGVAFGPRSERNYTKAMPKKARRTALFGLLTLKAQEGALVGIQGFDLQVIKTKDAISVIKLIGLADKKILIVLDAKNDILEKSLKNIDTIKYIYVDYLNPVDLMHNDAVLFLEPALEKINTLA